MTKRMVFCLIVASMAIGSALTLVSLLLWINTRQDFKVQALIIISGGEAEGTRPTADLPMYSFIGDNVTVGLNADYFSNEVILELRLPQGSRLRDYATTAFVESDL